MADDTRGVPVPGLAAMRKRATLSQEELAKRSGIGVATISRLERGANAHYATIDKLAKALKTSRKRLTSPPEQWVSRSGPQKQEAYSNDTHNHSTA
ncbi:MAG TPA: helix-turn-helix transcriptional regulator [Ktedonobacteraceae bacterium]